MIMRSGILREGTIMSLLGCSWVLVVRPTGRRLLSGVAGVEDIRRNDGLVVRFDTDPEANLGELVFTILSFYEGGTTRVKNIYMYSGDSLDLTMSPGSALVSDEFPTIHAAWPTSI